MHPNCSQIAFIFSCLSLLCITRGPLQLISSEDRVCRRSKLQSAFQIKRKSSAALGCLSMAEWPKHCYKQSPDIIPILCCSRLSKYGGLTKHCYNQSPDIIPILCCSRLSKYGVLTKHCYKQSPDIIPILCCFRLSKYGGLTKHCYNQSPDIIPTLTASNPRAPLARLD